MQGAVLARPPTAGLLVGAHRLRRHSAALHGPLQPHLGMNVPAPRGDEERYQLEFVRSPQRMLLIGPTTSNTDARSKSPGMRLLWSTGAVRLTRICSGKIGYPTNANACASRLQQMNRVAL